MAKLILKNPNYKKENILHSDKPYYVPVSKFIIEQCKLYQLDLSSEIFDIYLSEDQEKFFSVRAINFYLSTYLPKKILIDICNNLSNLVVYAISPCHDCDKNEDGTFKKPHFHLILRFNTNVSMAKVLVNYHTTQIRTLGENWFNEFHYLYHGTNQCRLEGKYLYPKEEIFTNDLDYCLLRAKANTVVVTAKSIINDMLNNMSTRALVDKYDFLYTRNCKNFQFIVDKIRREENSFIVRKIVNVVDLGDNLLIFYSTGTKEIISKNLIEKLNENQIILGESEKNES